MHNNMHNCSGDITTLLYSNICTLCMYPPTHLNYMFTCGTYQTLTAQNMTTVGFSCVYLRHA